MHWSLMHVVSQMTYTVDRWAGLRIRPFCCEEELIAYGSLSIHNAGDTDEQCDRLPRNIS